MREVLVCWLFCVMYTFVNWLLEPFFHASKFSFFHANHFKGMVEHKQWCDYRQIFFVSWFMFVVALHARVSRFALCPANLPVLQATGHVTKFQVRKGERESKGEFGYNRDFKKPRRQRGGQRRLKNEFIFYLQILWYFKVICFVSYCQN